jgi:hypothetical protein
MSFIMTGFSVVSSNKGSSSFNGSFLIPEKASNREFATLCGVSVSPSLCRSSPMANSISFTESEIEFLFLELITLILCAVKNSF